MCWVYLKTVNVDTHKHTLDTEPNIKQTLTRPPAPSVKKNGFPSRSNFIYCQSRNILGLSRQCWQGKNILVARGTLHLLLLFLHSPRYHDSSTKYFYEGFFLYSVMAEWSCSEEHRDHVQLKIIQPVEHWRSEILQCWWSRRVGPR